jgi:hypothetical protein
VAFEAGSQLSTIGSSVFVHCLSLVSVCLPSGIEQIGGAIPIRLKHDFGSINEFFSLCGDFLLALRCRVIVQYFGEAEEVNIGEVQSNLTVLRLGPFSFAGNSTLKSICIPLSVEVLCECCFARCENLSDVMFEQGSKLCVIADGAFSNCVSLKSICIPASVKTIGKSCFADCKNLSSFTFESGSESVVLGDKVFDGCFSLPSIPPPATRKVTGLLGFRERDKHPSTRVAPTRNYK